MEQVMVTAATSQELSVLIQAGAALRQQAYVPSEVYEGKIGTIRLILAITGIGKVNAASAVTALLERHTPRLLINTGCAGAYHGSGLAVGDLAIAVAEVFGDEGVLTPKGWEPLQAIGIPAAVRNGKSYYNEFPLSLLATEKAVHLAMALGLAVRRGRFVTVSTCSGTKERGDELAGRFGGICENMEGAAVAQVALAYGVDCLEIRGISNMVEDRDLATWNIPLAVAQSQRFILKLIETL